MNWKEFIDKNKDWIRAEHANGAINFFDKRNIFAKNTFRFSIMNDVYSIGDLSLAGINHTKKIIDFVSQDPKEWFKEPLYNIIVGHSKDFDKDYAIVAYRKCVNGYIVDNDANIHGMFEDEFEFTEKEIDDLKSWLPENMQKIVDLGKTEVKTDE